MAKSAPAAPQGDSENPGAGMSSAPGGNAAAGGNGATPRHKATYATDKRKGGYLVRVTGPDSNAFAGREVPVATKAGQQHPEKLVKVQWSGKDKESGENVTLYTFEGRPRDQDTIAW